MTFDPLAFIQTKKSNLKHSPDQIEAFIDGIVKGSIPDYQTSAWLMAVCFNGLSFNETFALTSAMASSGKVYKWDSDGPPVVDKHSTGGVGDTVTLILAPLVAAMGMRMGKHSGRGLGHTGGTIDKLESIPGFTTSLSEKKFRSIVDKVGCAVAGQDQRMTPADGILYALRDVTATVNEESLIAASIMSKKIAGGAPSILLDVKVGSGAFMKDRKSAESLSRLMIKLGQKSGKKVRSIISGMNSPLGRAVGNSLEVREAIRVLRNECDQNDPLLISCVEIASILGEMSGAGNIGNNRKLARGLISEGKALEKFRKMVKAQGGNSDVTDSPAEILPSARTILEFRASRECTVTKCDALILGELTRDLGGGRRSKSDIIDPAVGIVIIKMPDEKALKNDVICEIHTNGKIPDDEVTSRAQSAFSFSR